MACLGHDTSLLMPPGVSKCSDAPIHPAHQFAKFGAVWEYSIEKIDFKSIPHNVAVLAKVNGKWTTW